MLPSDFRAFDDQREEDGQHCEDERDPPIVDLELEERLVVVRKETNANGEGELACIDDDLQMRIMYTFLIKFSLALLSRVFSLRY